MNNTKNTKLDIVTAINNGGRDRELALSTIYNDQDLRGLTKRVIQRMGGDKFDVEDLFQEAIIILDRNIRGGKYRDEGSINSYFVSICRFQWKNMRRKNSRMTYNDDFAIDKTPSVPSPEDDFLDDERSFLLNEALEQIEGKGREVLKLWQLSYSMKEIADKVGISSVGMARKIKCQTMKKLVSLIHSDARFEDLNPKDSPSSRLNSEIESSAKVIRLGA